VRFRTESAATPPAENPMRERVEPILKFLYPKV
jgi:hypothetical protein